ncbi:MAG: hypothetical protein STSR0004_11510 [Peptococcaceae bacterium]
MEQRHKGTKEQRNKDTKERKVLLMLMRKGSFKLLVGLILFLTLVITAAGCQKKEPVELTVFSGAGLKDILPQITNEYSKKQPEIKVNINFASSGTLQKQIEQGAYAGLVYNSTARAAPDPEKIKIVAKAAPEMHKPIIFKEVLLKGTKEREKALDLLHFLAGPEALKIFEKYGFKPIVKE